jgi:hypothetical protein
MYYVSFSFVLPKEHIHKEVEVWEIVRMKYEILDEGKNAPRNAIGMKIQWWMWYRISCSFREKAKGNRKANTTALHEIPEYAESWADSSSTKILLSNLV